eukprot:TRINITY_DN2491_c0_g1_i1.p2 TRINITY_DN2491_c0_g1~~TRINITY_DN2491_c0_g1_i1.p2  ORF type:complete len:154 (-),score=25.03 TRINITY_DN2491_c0_g1_i1:895-1356(-)
MQGVHGVDIFAVVKTDGQDSKVVLTKQYRPPLDAYAVEWPAGLVDKGETPEQTAIRELQEETGYSGKVISSSPPICLESGLTDGCTSFIHVEVDGNTHGVPKQNLQDDEIIEVILVPLNTLFITLQQMASKKVIIDSKLYSFAYALHNASLLK